MLRFEGSDCSCSVGILVGDESEEVGRVGQMEQYRIYCLFDSLNHDLSFLL